MPKAFRISLPILLVAAVYFSWTLGEFFGSGSSDAAVIVMTLAVPAIGAANVVNAYLDREDGCPRRLAFWDMLLKLCMIPFYIIMAVGGSALMLGLAVVPGLIFALPVAAGMFFAIDFMLLLFTSSYGFAAAARAREQGLIDDGSATALTILHAVFIADVVAAVVLYVMIRSR